MKFAKNRIETDTGGGMVICRVRQIGKRSRS